MNEVSIYKIFDNKELFVREEVGPDDEYNLIGTDYTWSYMDHVWYRKTLTICDGKKIYLREPIRGGIEEIVSSSDFPAELLWHLNELRFISKIENRFGAWGFRIGK